MRIPLNIGSAARPSTRLKYLVMLDKKAAATNENPKS
jgi:hypothetical protein